MQIDFVEHSELLEYRLSGNHSEQDWVDLLHQIDADVKRSGITRAFVDATQVTISTDAMLRYRMGLLTGQLFGAITRIAVLKSEKDSDDFWQTVASNRGVMARSGHDREGLLQWLLSDE